jgi:drug/metabolite transporter (DMT)-like permease
VIAVLRARLPELALLGVVVVWASTFVRFAGITLLAFVALCGSVRAGRASWGIWRGDLVRFALVGVCGYTFYQLGFVLGLERTSPFSSALLIVTVPLVTIIVLRMLGERSPLRTWLGVAIAIVGTVIFMSDMWGAAGLIRLVGDVLSLG